MKAETRKFLLNHPFLLGADEEGEDVYMEDDEPMFEVLGSMLEEYHTLKSQEEAEEITNLFSKWHNLELGSFELEAAIKELIDKR